MERRWHDVGSVHAEWSRRGYGGLLSAIAPLGVLMAVGKMWSRPPATTLERKPTPEEEDAELKLQAAGVFAGITLFTLLIPGLALYRASRSS